MQDVLESILTMVVRMLQAPPTVSFSLIRLSGLSLIPASVALYLTLAALLTAVLPDNSVFYRSRVFVRAGFRSAPPIVIPVHSPAVLGPRHDLQMVRVDAGSYAAQVVKSRVLWDGATQAFIGEGVRAPRGKRPVAVTLAALPKPATTRLVKGDVAKESDGAGEFGGVVVPQRERGDFLEVHNVLSTQEKRQWGRGAGVESRRSADDRSAIAL